ncbi:MAG TPA: CRISPR-associated helicase Cas3' [Epulopiscium sp.]|nr:CRISPR-associated helicase Cas3' [Candidatus Epulonipiscium sp.]
MKIARFCEKTNSVQSVQEHLDNVSKYARERVGNINLAKTACLIGLLHDMGKLSAEFQEYIKKQMTDKDNNQKGIKVDHAVYGAKYIYDRYKNGNKMEQYSSQVISLVICYHHGGLPNCIDTNNKITLIERINKVCDTSYKEVKEEFEEIYTQEKLEILFSEANKEIECCLRKISGGASDKDNIPFEVHLLVKVLYSVIIDSDWLDSYLFEVKKPYLEGPKLISDIDLYSQNLEEKLDKFKKINPISEKQGVVFQKRNEIANDCLEFSNMPTGVYTLTVPTGGGKTISSLRFALNHAKKQGKERIFYIAPYTSIIEQNAGEIREIIKCGDNLLEYHSNILSDTTEEKVAYEDKKDIKILSDRWDYQFVFTTMVQFLNTLYAAPSSNIRRLQSLSNSVIIFDEVQSVPMYCISLFNGAVNFLSKCLNCTIILCTATQPVLHEVNRPIKLSKDNEIVKNVPDAFEKLKRVKVIDKTRPEGYNHQDLADFIIDSVAEKPSILLIVNTVNTAESIYALLEKEDFKGTLYYLSSNICPSHRMAVVEAMKKSLAQKEATICISTQVIECGVDISFACVIRSLSGLDSIAQASGRCNRHGEVEEAETYIMNFQKEYENTTRLKSIEIGKLKTTGILDLYKRDPTKFDDSLLSTKAIYQYFRRFIKEDSVEKEFDYPITKEGGTIHNLLSSNQSLRRLYDATSDTKYNLYFCFQFKDARQHFKVIEDNTKALIVPYGKGKELINDLGSSLNFEGKIGALKIAQTYSVNVFDYKFKMLDEVGAISGCDVEGVYILNDGFYDESKGIVLEKKLSPLFL